MVEIDRSIFVFINSLNSPFFDEVMRVVSMKAVWIPLYLLIIYLLVVRYKAKTLIILLFAVLLVVITDQLTELIKNTVERLRPCHDPALEGIVHLVRGRCGGLYGFVSGHAANTFGVAAFSAPLVRKKWYSWMIFLWAALVSYSRVYLGVHYPGDILGGAILGMTTGFVLVYIVRKILERKS